VYEGGGSDRFYLRTPINWDPATGRVGFFGIVPDGATVQITVAGTEQIFEGARASMEEALAAFPAGKTRMRRSCTRAPPGGTCSAHASGGVRDGARPAWDGHPDRRHVLPRRDRPMASPDRTQFHNATMVSVLLGAS